MLLIIRHLLFRVIMFIYQISCIYIAYIPGTDREPLCIEGMSKHWEPTRNPIRRFIDAWAANDKNGLLCRVVAVLLDDNCKNIVIWRAEKMNDRECRKLYVQQHE
jgi:hypothetical protein